LQAGDEKAADSSGIRDGQGIGEIGAAIKKSEPDKNQALSFPSK
jgi:hypothetical protein